MATALKAYQIKWRLRPGARLQTGVRYAKNLDLAWRQAYNAFREHHPGVIIESVKQTKNKNPGGCIAMSNPKSRRKGSLTHARSVAKEALKAGPIGGKVTIGTWFGSGKYAIKVGAVKTSKGHPNSPHTWIGHEVWAKVKGKTAAGRIVKQGKL